MDIWKMKMLKNKRGSSGLLFLYWIAVMTLFAIDFYWVVASFYGAPYDIREVEANLLINRVADCVSYGGRINSNLSFTNITSEKNSLFFDNCPLNFSTGNEKIQYYVRINFYKIDNLNEPVLNLSRGNSDLVPYCSSQETKQYGNLPVCSEKSFYSLDDSDNQYIIKILTIVNRADKNANGITSTSKEEDNTAQVESVCSSLCAINDTESYCIKDRILMYGTSRFLGSCYAYSKTGKYGISECEGLCSSSTSTDIKIESGGI